jgi:hypothetical protein
MEVVGGFASGFLTVSTSVKTTERSPLVSVSILPGERLARVRYPRLQPNSAPQRDDAMGHLQKFSLEAASRHAVRNRACGGVAR